MHKSFREKVLRTTSAAGQLRNARSGWRPVLMAMVLGSIVLAGCETGVDAFEPSDRYFTVFSILNVDADSQLVRVVAVRHNILPDDDVLDAEVTLEEADTGQMEVLPETLVTFPSVRKEKGFLFESRMDIVSGRRYTLTVRRSDGATSRATVEAPVPPGAPEVSSFVTGTTSRTAKRVHWNEAFIPAAVEVIYTARLAGIDESVRRVTVPHTYDVTKGDGATEMTVFLLDDGSDVFNAFELPVGTQVSAVEILGAELHVVRANDEWTFINAGYDLETLALPGLFSNVENGFGFVGSVAGATYPFDLTQDDVAAMGFTDGIHGSN